ncbi:unnamed protein product [Clonostachys rosea f. rosea IK726]|uniref:Uncharacterized protein n=1 Tax=Clonostachys rosea f. rosea IK726 TaxID=1349383 RepID=A0ACA9U4E3_BIOOC|nr:unnamed protein product [Clonostachys rosea f. rosea IK726]
MEFRFVDEHGPVALRRRRLQAQRAKRCRQRKNGQQCIEPSIDQAESSHTVDSTADNVQTLDYYDEEMVDAYSIDEREDQMEPRSPDVFAGIQTGRPHGNTWNDL